MIGIITWSLINYQFQWRLITSGGNLQESQLPSKFDYLLRVLEFMAIILL